MVKNNEILLFLLIFAIFTSLISFFVFLSSSGFIERIEISSLSSIPDLSLKGYAKIERINVEVYQDVGVIHLYAKCYKLTAYTEKKQAESIKEAIIGKRSFRPNTHDLFSDVLKNLGIKLLMVKIVDLRNNTYIGRLILKQGNRILSLDCRPSDGTALALRLGAPIYIKESILRSQGKYIC